MLNAAKNRRELIAAQLSRRELIRMGLITSAGFLAPIKGLSAQQQPAQPPTGSNAVCVAENEAASPPTRAFVEPLQILPIFQPVPSLDPAPTVEPNTAAGESRTRPHQALTIFPPKKFYSISQQPLQVSMHPDLPIQTVWGLRDSHGNASFPSPTYVSRYGEANLVRNFNNLPPRNQNGGFGMPSVSTHLHNGHTPSESDGFPCDFFERGHCWLESSPLTPALATSMSHSARCFTTTTAWTLLPRIATRVW
jgi:hypothetical protein